MKIRSSDLTVNRVFSIILSCALLLIPVGVCAAPVTPVLTGAEAVTQTGFDATWGAVGGAVGYQLDVAVNPLFTSYVSGYIARDVASVTRYTVVGLNSGTTYYYRVRAYDASGTGLNSNVGALVTLPATPGVPAISAATGVSQSGFTAAWTAAGGATGYLLDVATDTGFSAPVNGYAGRDVANVTSFPVTDLAAGTAYYYRVRAYNNGGTSISSNTGTLATKLVIPAAPLASGALSVTQNSFTATWGAVAGATAYLLDVSTTAGFSTLLPGYNALNVANVTSFNVSGLTSGTTYYYRVRAGNSGGTGAYSNICALIALSPNPAAPVVADAASVTQTGFIAGWGPVSGASGYLLDVAGDPLFTAPVGIYGALDVGGVTSFSVSGLSPGAPYFYRIRFYDGAGPGSYSNVGALVTLPATPGVPTGVTVTSVTASGFIAGWTAVPGATGYQLDVASDSGFNTPVAGYNSRELANVTSSPVSALSPGSAYYFRVRSINSGGISVSSNYVPLLTLPAVPGVPTVNGAASVTQTVFSATWSTVSGATGYWLDVSTTAAFTTFVTGYSRDVSNVTSFNVAGLTPGVTYYYRVRANNAGGSSANSVTSALVTMPLTPAAPVATAATVVSQTGFTAKWGAVAGVNGYLLDVATDVLFSAFVSGFTNLDVGNVTGYAISGLAPGTAYFYRVRAYNNSGASINSGTITTTTIPLAPVASEATAVTQAGFTANWGAVSGATGYRFDVATDAAFSAILASYKDKVVTGATGAAVIGLTPGTVYYYRLRAYTSGGASENSGSITLTTLATPVAMPATNVSSNGFTANWNPAVGGVDYLLDVSISSSFASFIIKDQNVTSGTGFVVTGLTGGITYYYRVRSRNSFTVSTNSNVVSQSTLTVPLATAATFVTQTGFIATWAAAGAAAGYLLDVATDPSFSGILPAYSNLDVFKVTSYPVSGLTAGVTYYYRVRSYTTVATSGDSNTISQITLATPLATAATTITPTGFKAAWGTVSGATGYRLDVATDAGFSGLLATYSDKNVLNVTSYAVSGLTAGTVYYYRVRAYNATATSVSSNSVSLTTVPPTPLATPASAVTQTGFTANWNPALSASGYRLDVAANSSFTTPVAGFTDLNVSNVTSYPVSGLAVGTVYYYRVRATNISGSTVNSNTVSQFTLATPVATAATAVTQTGFTATWGVANGAAGYLLDVAGDAAFTTILSGYNALDVGNVTSAPVSGLSPGSIYYYRVRSYTAAAVSSNSGSIIQTTLATPVATAATTIIQTGFKATWGAVSGATGYRLDVAGDAGFTGIITGYDDKNVLNVTNYTVSGLTAGTTYYYRVRAYNGTGASVSSNPISLTTIPPNPVATSATQVTPVSFTINWGATPSATGYLLDVATNSTFTAPVTGFSNLDVLNVTSYQISGLAVGVTYYYRIRAVNFGGTSGNSNTISQTTLTTPVATAATLVTQDSFNATWSAAGGAGGYQLDVATDPLFNSFVIGYSNRDVGNVTSSPVSGLSAGVIYYYRVRAYTSAATTGNSNAISQITLATPVATAATSVTQTSFKATWLAVIGATGYRLDVATDPGFTTVLTAYDNKNVLNVTNYAVSGLTTGINYYYRVRAYNVTTTTASSNVVNPTTFPSVPVAVAATAITQTAFTANWNPSVGAGGYRLDVATNSTFSSFVEGFNDLNVNNVTAYPVVGLSAGVTYYYRLRAYNAGGIGISSVPSITVTTVPSAPVATAATTITQTGFKATWNAAGGATGYLLDVALDAGFTTLVSGYSDKDVANVTSFVIGGLSSGTSYYYRVRAYTTGGSSDSSNVISQATMATPVATPATFITQTGFTATWGTVSGATTYKLDVATNAAFTAFVTGFKDRDTGDVTSMAVSGLIAGSTYYYRLRAINAGVTSVNSNVITQPTLGTPLATAPSTITQTGFSASWGQSSAATGYLLDVASDSAFTAIVAGYNNLDVGQVTTFSVTGLASGTTFYYRVRAYSSGGASSNSNKISLTTLPATPQAPVTISATAVTQYTLTANWISSGRATGYRLDVATDAAFALPVSGYSNRDVANVTSVSLSSLAAGTTYYYRVRAYNSGGTSVSSAVVSQVTLPPTPPEAPVAAAAGIPTSSGFTANWSVVTGVNGYVLDVAIDPAFSGMVADYTNRDVANVTSFAVSGLASGSVYYYRLRAYNAAGTSIVSNAITVTTKPSLPLAAPAAGITITGFVASWGAVTGATGYQLDVASDSNFSQFVSGYPRDVAYVISSSVSGLIAGTTYYYRVRAYSSAGTGADSNTVALTTVPVAPHAVSAHSVTRTDFNASWEISAGALGYLLDVATDPGFTGFVAGYDNRDTGNVTTAAVSGLTPGTTYYYRVRAYTGGGTGLNSNTIIQATLPAAPPAPVAKAASFITPNGFTANWVAVYGASGYRIDVSDSADFSSFVVGYNNYDVGTTLQLDVVGLIPGTGYYYRLRSYNSGGSGADSNSIAVAVTSAPLTVTVAGSGAGSVHSDTGGIACASGSTADCSAPYDGGIVVTLSATPDTNSIFSGWSGACSGTAPCLVTMDAEKTVTAIFSIMPPVRIYDAVSPRYFDTLQAAYNAASTGDVIQLRDGSLPGDLLADRAVIISVKGGFDATYSANSLDTLLQGIVRVQQGSVRMERIKVGM
jgi:titin